MRNRTIWLFAPAFALLGGCSVLTPPAQIKAIEGSGTYWINYDSDRRGAILNNSSTGLKICAEPSPDTSKDADFDSRLKQQEVIDASAKAGLKTVVLPGRNSTVLALRESLYRLCELSINRPNVSDNDLIKYYSDIIKAVIDYADADARKSEAITKEILTSSKSVSPVRLSRSAASDEELSGFERILKDDFVGALDKFTRAEAIYPGYHNVYEIGSALKKYLSDNKMTDEEKQSLLRDIAGKWRWGVPDDILLEIKTKIK